jgi:hypothetical protein
MSEIASNRPGGDDESLGPARLVEQLRVLGQRTGAAARGYWLPLVLFGALIFASLPFYQRLHSVPAVARLSPGTATVHVIRTEVAAIGYYWQLALLAGVVLTALWYRWRGNRTGLRTPARGFLITGLVLSELVLLVPLLIGQSNSLAVSRLVHSTHQAGPLVIIAVLLWTLAWSERSRALAIITGGYFVAALVVTAFTNGGLTGGTTGAADISLNALRLLGAIPGLILVVAGAVTWLTARRATSDTGRD